MFDSGIKASELIEQIKDEADIAVPIPDSSYVLWINALEQLLYTELIREQGKTAVSGLAVSTVGIGNLTVQKGEAPIRYEDIYAVYADKKQLIESTVASGTIFKDTYYKTGNDVGINLSQKANTITFIYIVKPALKTASNISSTNVMVPLEFIDIVKAKLRAEAYKIANEDSLAAKWMNDYNALLETFKSWLSGKQPEFGM